MSVAVQITLIICGTLVLSCLIGTRNNRKEDTNYEGKKPTREQHKQIEKNGLNSDDWLVQKAYAACAP